MHFPPLICDQKVDTYQILQSSQTVKNLPAMQETRVGSLGGKTPWRRKWQPTPEFLPGESHEQRSLAAHWVSKSWTQLMQLSMHAGTQTTALSRIILKLKSCGTETLYMIEDFLIAPDRMYKIWWKVPINWKQFQVVLWILTHFIIKIISLASNRK